MQNATKDIDVRIALFEIPANRVRPGPLRFKEFRNDDIAPHLYNMFIGSWGMFPHHDQVPLYFSKQIYVEFVLHMRLDYTNTTLTLYESYRGHNYDHYGAHRDPTHVPPPLILVPLPSWSIVLSTELKDPS